MEAQTTASDEERAGSSLGIMATRGFGPYCVGNFLSNCGTWFQNIAQALLIYRLTKSVFLVGVVNFAQFAGIFILAPWSGSAADRFDRRRLIIVTQLASFAVTATLAALTAAHMAPAPVVIGMALLLGLATAFAIPAIQALVPLLVPVRDVPAAIALSSVTFTGARAIGPVVGALIIRRYGIVTAFAVNSLSYVALIVGLTVTRPRPQAARPTTPPRLRESIALISRDKMLLVYLAVIAVVANSQDPVSTLTPAFATRIFHQPDSSTGFLVGAFGLGAAVAGVALARGRRDTHRTMVCSTAVLGLAMVTFGLAHSLVVAYGALFIGGIGFLAAMTTSTTLVQLDVDDSQRGRVMAVWSVAFLGLRPFGSLLDGALASRFGLRAATLTMAAPALLASLGLVLLARWRRTSRG